MKIYKEIKDNKKFFLDNLSKFIKSGDVLNMELDVMRFGKLFDTTITKNEYLNFFLDIFKNLIGPNGTIIIPGFSYSWGYTEKKKFFDIKKTKAKTGIFPEYLRTNPETKRTLDPMFSFFAYGADKDFFMDISNDSFGKKSVFEKIYKKNGKLISFGLSGFDPTFVHYVEQYFDAEIEKINYRSLLEFKGELIDYSGIKKEGLHYSFMRSKDSTFTFCGEKIKKCLSENNLIEEIKIIHGKVQIVNSKDFFDLGLERMKKDKNFFVKVS